LRLAVSDVYRHPMKRLCVVSYKMSHQKANLLEAPVHIGLDVQSVNSAININRRLKLTHLPKQDEINGGG